MLRAFANYGHVSCVTKVTLLVKWVKQIDYFRRYFIMNLEKILEQINEACTGCEDCDPCCTRNILRKCIENDRVVLTEAGAYRSIEPAPNYCNAA